MSYFGACIQLSSVCPLMLTIFRLARETSKRHPTLARPPRTSAPLMLNARTPSSFVCRLSAIAIAVALLAGCAGRPDSSSARPGAAESTAIADSIRSLVRAAYDLSAPDVPTRMLSIYPSEGSVISATAGRVTNTREMLGSAVQSFWDGVGRFMVRPSWNWESIDVDVLSRDVAVMTAQYTVRHWTYTGAPHVIGGVWTAVWQRRNGRWEVTHEHLSDMPRPTAERIEAEMPTIEPSTPPNPDSVPAR